MGIKQDLKRFNKIVKGKMRDNLKEFIKQGKMVGKKGDNEFVVPMPSIDIPRFKYGKNENSKGVGQGDGEPGDPANGEQQPGEGEAGDGEGKKGMDAVFTAEELAQILGDELELPRIEPKGKPSLIKYTNKYKSIGPIGPNSLKHFKKTYFEAMKREFSMGNTSLNNIFPIKADERFRQPKPEIIRDNSAVIFYIMDVSGSMGDEQKKVVRNTSFWINTWLSAHYPNLEMKYIIHDSTAKEVSEKEFFETKESGGTIISSSYNLAKEIIMEDYSDWNIYVFQFSDGDSWGDEDMNACTDMLDDFFLPYTNLFCYGNVESRYGSSAYLKVLKDKYPENDNLIIYNIRGMEDIVNAIKAFLGKGK